MKKKSGLFSQRLRPDNYSHVGQSPCFTMAFWPRWEEHPFQLGTQRKASVQHGWKRWKASHDKHMFKMFIHHFVLCKKTHIFFFYIVESTRISQFKDVLWEILAKTTSGPSRIFPKFPGRSPRSPVDVPRFQFMGIGWESHGQFPLFFDEIFQSVLMKLFPLVWWEFP